MAADQFQFKQFTIQQSNCAMKVGTDGVLLGAWADINNAKHILDLGTGTGLLALMLAQRSSNDVKILATEIEPQALLQAQQNIQNSPWHKQISLLKQNVEKLEQLKTHPDFEPFDCIVANPPYFPQGVDCRNESRNLARYTQAETHLTWLSQAQSCLSASGKIHFVLPYDAGKLLQKQSPLYCVKETQVITKQGKTPSRILLTFSPEFATCEQNELIIYNQQSQYTEQFIELTKEFYLKF